MPDTLKPHDADELLKAVAWAAAGQKTLEVLAGGSKRGVGRPAQTDLTLDLSRLTGITLYEPRELVLSAKAGTPLSEIEQALAAEGQELAFEPADYGALLGGKAGRATLGGVIAANVSGPRRVKAGAARDHFLGVHAVSGRGEAFKSGGRVVKNVTGYDLCKVLAGSWGRLAVMTDITVKVLPAAEDERGVVIAGLDAASAARAMAEAMGSPCEVSAAAHIPETLTALSRVEPVRSAGSALTVLRLEGVGPSVAYRVEKLKDMLKSHGEIGELSASASKAFWREARDVSFLAEEPGRPLWRVSVAPGDGAALVEKVLAGADARAIYDWAGGLIWIELPKSDDAGAAIVRGALDGIGGHATLMRAEAAARAAIEVFQPQPAALATLSARLKAGFDPKGILNPGRMYAGV